MQGVCLGPSPFDTRAEKYAHGYPSSHPGSSGKASKAHKPIPGRHALNDFPAPYKGCPVAFMRLTILPFHRKIALRSASPRSDHFPMISPFNSSTSLLNLSKFPKAISMLTAMSSGRLEVKRAPFQKYSLRAP